MLTTFAKATYMFMLLFMVVLGTSVGRFSKTQRNKITAV